MESKYLIDSDAYIGLYSKDDLLHDKMVTVFSGFKISSSKFYTSWDVIDEVATKLSYKNSKKLSNKFLSDLQNSDTEILFSDEEILDKTINLFSSIASKNVSFTDCVNMVWAKELKIDNIISLDKIYKKQGFEVLI